MLLNFPLALSVAEPYICISLSMGRFQLYVCANWWAVKAAFHRLFGRATFSAHFQALNAIDANLANVNVNVDVPAAPGPAGVAAEVAVIVAATALT